MLTIRDTYSRHVYNNNVLNDIVLQKKIQIYNGHQFAMCWLFNFPLHIHYTHTGSGTGTHTVK